MTLAGGLITGVLIAAIGALVLLGQRSHSNGRARRHHTSADDRPPHQHDSMKGTPP